MFQSISIVLLEKATISSKTSIILYLYLYNKFFVPVAIIERNNIRWRVQFGELL